jgi:uncharacterized membrane protein YhaH (DUF805 family)
MRAAMNWTYWTYVFTSFSGRINREPFWIACGILVALQIATQWLAYQIEGERLAAVFDLAITYPQFAVAAKRGNDRNLPLWVVRLFFAFSVALDLFILLTGNFEFDADDPLNAVIAYPFGLVILILLVELGFRRGTEGTNRFGPDPLAGKI